MVRGVWAGVCLVFLAAACGGGGGEMSQTEYVERLNTIVDQAAREYEALVTSPQGGVLVADAEQLSDFTPQDLQVALERVREIETKVEVATGAIEPPQQLAELHEFFFDFDGAFISSQEALATQAGIATDWHELSASPEMEAYRTALAADKQACVDAEAELNAGAEGGGFAIDAWLAADLKEVIEAVLGCSGYPEHPEDVYRPATR
jgi:hypothetical protein